MNARTEGAQLVDWPALQAACAPGDLELIGRIVQRSVDMTLARIAANPSKRGQVVDAAVERGALSTAQTIMVMKIMHLHATTCPLHLMRWLMSDAEDFRHDFAGIDAHLDTDTGHLGGGFWPIFAQHARQPATH